MDAHILAKYLIFILTDKRSAIEENHLPEIRRCLITLFVTFKKEIKVTHLDPLLKVLNDICNEKGNEPEHENFIGWAWDVFMIALHLAKKESKCSEYDFLQIYVNKIALSNITKEVPENKLKELRKIFIKAYQMTYKDSYSLIGLCTRTLLVANQQRCDQIWDAETFFNQKEIIHTPLKSKLGFFIPYQQYEKQVTELKANVLLDISMVRNLACNQLLGSYAIAHQETQIQLYYKNFQNCLYYYELTIDSGIKIMGKYELIPFEDNTFLSQPCTLEEANTDQSTFLSKEIPHDQVIIESINELVRTLINQGELNSEYDSAPYKMSSDVDIPSFEDFMTSDYGATL